MTLICRAHSRRYLLFQIGSRTCPFLAASFSCLLLATLSLVREAIPSVSRFVAFAFSSFDSMNSSLFGYAGSYARPPSIPVPPRPPVSVASPATTTTAARCCSRFARSSPRAARLRLHLPRYATAPVLFPLPSPPRPASCCFVRYARCCGGQECLSILNAGGHRGCCCCLCSS